MRCKALKTGYAIKRLVSLNGKQEVPVKPTWGEKSWTSSVTVEIHLVTKRMTSVLISNSAGGGFGFQLIELAYLKLKERTRSFPF